MISKLLEKLRKFKTEKRDCMVIYDKVRNKYYGVWKPWSLHENEIVFDEDMTEEEAGAAAQDLNNEIGLTVYFEEEKEKHVCPMCSFELNRDGCGDYDIYYCPICVEYLPSSSVY